MIIKLSIVQTERSHLTFSHLFFSQSFGDQSVAEISRISCEVINVVNTEWCALCSSLREPECQRRG